MAAMSKKTLVPLTALEAKIKFTEIAVQLAWEMGFIEVTFKTDSLNLCKVLTGSIEALSSIETITASILSLVQNFRFLLFHMSNGKAISLSIF